ncbi:protein kinase [Pseudidiomarina sp. 1APP75-32.1]|uniref:non-specific serine/threonine protein kinase n=1 Tax=Pseudidiomarina terrestris TaxID=2820060 RepID=A0AAW7QYR9_9GAMM|nr:MULTISPECIES: protein kinase [unclassified Pseudidiomarina]MDN7125302.1 protein kinase [Pseudidiomarina sp. 1APP75-32.1]MDN7130061.1 protein kinase [Pseudidiomarina sp. 1APR75-15]
MTDVTEPDQPNDPAETKRASQHLLVPGQELAHRFKIVKLLGRGGQASVYQAFDTVLEEECAVKLLAADAPVTAESIEQLRNEVILARQLQHPNIVRVHEFYATDDFVFFTMSLIEGKSLQEVLEQPLSAEQCLGWFKALVSALQSCHENGIIHGDIKPANIVVTDDNEVKIVDFGIGTTTTDAITHHFSEGYTAPEVARSHVPTTAGDRYALGKVLEQLLAAITPKSWQNVTVKRRALQQLAAALQADEPERRPSLATCLATLEPQSPRRFIMPAALLLLIAAVIGFWLWRAAPPAVDATTAPDAPIATLGIYSNEDYVAIAQLVHLTLQTEPDLYSIEPSTIQRLVERLGIQPERAERERSRLAQITEADYLLTLSNKTVGTASQLHALLTVYPGEQVLMSSTYTVSDQTAQQLATQVSSQVKDYLLTAERSSSTTTSTSELALLEQLQAARSQDDPDALYAQLKSIVDADVSGYWKLQARAELAQLDQQFEAAAEILDELLVRYPQRADIAAQRAQVASQLGHLETAREYYQKALALDPQQPYWWFELARLKIIQGETQSALQQELTQALIIFGQRESDEGQGLVLNAFGVGHLRLAQYQQALRYFSQALEYRSAEKYPQDRITTLGNYATVAAILRDFAAADAALKEATTLAKAQDDPLAVAHIENERGLLNEEQGFYQQALVHYKRALDLRLREGSPYVQSQSINNVAFINFLLGDYSLAEVYWRQALQIVTELNETSTLHSIQVSLAHLLGLQGQFRQAEQLLAELFTAADISPEASMAAHIQASRLNFAQSRMAAAAESIDEAIRIADEIGDTRGLTESLLWEAEIAFHLHQTQALENNLERLSKLSESFNREQALTFHWLQEMLRYRLTQNNDFTTLADTVLAQNWSQLLEAKILTEVAFYGDFSSSHPIWQRLDELNNETIYASHLLYLAAQDTPTAQQQLQSRLQRFPDYWRNFELYRVLSSDSAKQHAQEALEQLLDKMNEAQREAYQRFAQL